MQKFPLAICPSLDRTKSDTTLVVVDMQEGSKAANHRPTLETVKKLLGIACTNNWGIVFLEIKNAFESYGPTHACLLEPVKSYKLIHRFEKPEKDGSEFVLQACNQSHLGTKRFILCGVNLDACVVWTANGISRLFPESAIEIVHQACHSENPCMWQTWQAFVAHGNIKVVSIH